MGTIENKALLKIWVYSNETVRGNSLYELIVLKAKELGLAGATVVRGVMGYIGDDKMHKPKLFSITENLPVMIEVIDTEHNINKLLPFLDESIRSGLVVLMPISSTGAIKERGEKYESRDIQK